MINRERTAVFIDGSNVYATARALNFEMDYKALLKWLDDKYGDLFRVYYFTAIVQDDEYSSIRPLIDWLDYNGYAVITKATKSFTDAEGRRKLKGNMDVELTVHMLEAAQFVDTIVLFSGDGDFRFVVEAVQRKGCRVDVVSTMATAQPMIADELRRQADAFVEINDQPIRKAGGREHRARPQPVAASA